MNYEYTVLSENIYGVMQQELNSYGRYGWKLVNAVWDNDNACLVAVMMREDNSSLPLFTIFVEDHIESFNCH